MISEFLRTSREYSPVKIEILFINPFFDENGENDLLWAIETFWKYKLKSELKKKECERKFIYAICNQRKKMFIYRN